MSPIPKFTCPVPTFLNTTRMWPIAYLVSPCECLKGISNLIFKSETLASPLSTPCQTCPSPQSFLNSRNDNIIYSVTKSNKYLDSLPHSLPIVYLTTSTASISQAAIAFSLGCCKNLLTGLLASISTLIQHLEWPLYRLNPTISLSCTQQSSASQDTYFQISNPYSGQQSHAIWSLVVSPTSYLKQMGGFLVFSPLLNHALLNMAFLLLLLLKHFRNFFIPRLMILLSLWKTLPDICILPHFTQCYLRDTFTDHPA